MPLALNNDDDRVLLIAYLAQSTHCDETSSNEKIFRLDIIPLTPEHDSLFTPPNTLVHHEALLTFFLNNDITLLFEHNDSDTSEFLAIAKYLNISTTKYSASQKPGKVEEILIIMSCLYLLTRLKLQRHHHLDNKALALDASQHSEARRSPD